jgi:hypothetical protein
MKVIRRLTKDFCLASGDRIPARASVGQPLQAVLGEEG